MRPGKIKILFITNTPPVPSQGGAMTFYRHFVESGDFEIAVITDDRRILDYKLPYQYLLVNEGRLGKRISNTRLYPYIQTLRKLIGVKNIHPDILLFASNFNADAIFTVGGTWNWMAIIARKVARKLRIPLIGSFNDWWTYASVYHPAASKRIEKKFKNFYRSCNLAICTSEGMKQELGSHNNAIIIYPTGAKMEEQRVSKNLNSEFKIAFAGNLGDWYGHMLEEIIANNEDKNIRFQIYGFNPSWSEACHQKVLEDNIYLGELSFDALRQQIFSCDALLLLMGFGEDEAIIEKTSFKTKFLDYLTFQRPILLWGPEYSSAVQIAREFDSAEICTSSNVYDFLRIIQKLKNNPKRQNELIENALNMYQERFRPDLIHKKLVSGIRSILL